MAQRQAAKSDEWYTPAYAVEPIIPYLKKNSTVWCPFDLPESNYVKCLKENGFKVIHSHISEGKDFFKQEVPECDYIVSNPPYSLKDDILERLIAIEKPFAMLLNVSGLFDSKKRFELLKDNPIEILYMYPRVDFFNFDRRGEKSSPTYQSSYVCKNILPTQIAAVKINKQKEPTSSANEVSC